MGKYISFIKPPKKYFQYLLSFILCTIFCLFLSLIFKIWIKKSNNDSSNLRKNNLVQELLENIGTSLLIIPELFMNENFSSKEIKSSTLKNKSNIKSFIIIGIISLIMLINIFGNIFFELYLLEKTKEQILSNNFGLYYFFIYIISIVYFKCTYYFHQSIFSLIIIVFAIIRIIIKLDQYDFFSSKPKEIIIESFLIIFNSFTKAFYVSFYKILIEKYYFSTYKIGYLFGFIISIIILIVIFILSYISCDKNFLCSIEYENKYYFENIFSFFSRYTYPEIIQIITFYTLLPLRSIFIISIIQKFTLCHIFLAFQFGELFFTFHEIDLYKHKNTLPIEIIAFIFEIFFTLVFLEIIELKFCGLNKYIRKNIEKRALDDANNSLLGEEKNIFEFSKGYIIDYDNQETEIEKDGEKKEKKIEEKENKKIELKNLDNS